jgi:hypothetical protein
MLEYISNSTFDSMMDLNKEEIKKVETKPKAPAKGAKENKD